MTTNTKGHAVAAKNSSAAQGQSKTTLPGNAISLLTPDKLKQIYRCMLKCRMVQERVSLLLRERKPKGKQFPGARLWGNTVGHEATEIATTIDLLPDDTLAPSHRGIVTDVMRGVSLEAIFGRLYPQRGADPEGTNSGPTHAITPAMAVDAQFSMATGVALAYKWQKRSNVVLVLSGKDSNSVSLWHESVRYAGTHRLPIVYVIETDTCGPTVEQAVEDIGVKLQRYEFPVITVDGNDAVAVYRVSSEAISRARNNGGPTLIDARICCWPVMDAPEEWQSDDPIPHMQRYLRKRSLWSNKWQQGIIDEIVEQIEQAIEKVESSRKRPPEDAAGRVLSFSIRDREV